MSLIDEIRKDREAGAPGAWEAESEYQGDEWGSGWRVIALNPVDTIAENILSGEDARRCARVPAMEAAVLAGDTLAECIDAWLSDGPINLSQIENALAAYRKVTR